MLAELNIQADNATQSTIVSLQRRLSDTLNLTCLVKEIRWNLTHDEGLKAALQKLVIRLDERAEDLATLIANLGASVDASTENRVPPSTNIGLTPRLDRSTSDLPPLFEAIVAFQKDIKRSAQETKATGSVRAYEALANLSRDLDVALWELGPFLPATEGTPS